MSNKNQTTGFEHDHVATEKQNAPCTMGQRAYDLSTTRRDPSAWTNGLTARPSSLQWSVCWKHALARNSGAMHMKWLDLNLKFKLVAFRVTPLSCPWPSLALSDNHIKLKHCCIAAEQRSCVTSPTKPQCSVTPSRATRLRSFWGPCHPFKSQRSQITAP